MTGAEGGTDLVAVTHEVMYRDEALVDDNPARIESPLQQEVGQGRYGDIWLVGTLQ